MVLSKNRAKLAKTVLILTNRIKKSCETIRIRFCKLTNKYLNLHCKPKRRTSAREEREGWQTYFFRKAFTMTLFLDVPKSGKFLIAIKNVANGRCLVGMLYPYGMVSVTPWLYAYIHICVRLLRVCSFNRNGHSRASERGTSKRVRFPTLFLCLFVDALAAGRRAEYSLPNAKG